MALAISNQAVPRPLPTWASIPIILICLLSGGWIIHWYMISDPMSHEAKILGDAPAPMQFPAWAGGGGGRQRVGANAQRNIFMRNDGVWQARTAQARMDASFTNGKFVWHTITYTGDYAFVPESVRNTILTAREVVTNDKRISALKLTSEQVRKLKGLSATITMNVSDPDRAQLAALMKAYIQAPATQHPAMELKVLSALDAVAQKSIGATIQQATARAASINSLVTPQQWKINSSLTGK